MGKITKTIRNTLALWLLLMPCAYAFPTVIVLSDKTINKAIISIARNYSLQNNIVVNTAFTSPDIQQEQIMDGAAADVVITPLESWVEELKSRGLVDVYSQVEIASNRLALVTSANNPIQLSLANGFPTAEIIQSMNWEQSFIVGHPQTQIEGIYAKQVLREMKAASDLEPYTLYIKRYDQTIEKLKENNTYGVFFYTTVKDQKDLRVLDFFPENTYPPIRYYAVVIAGENMNEARKFVNYLNSKDARRTLVSQGFIVKP